MAVSAEGRILICREYCGVTRWESTPACNTLQAVLSVETETYDERLIKVDGQARYKSAIERQPTKPSTRQET